MAIGFIILASFIIGLIAAVIGLAQRLKLLAETVSHIRSVSLDLSSNAYQHARFCCNEFNHIGNALANHKEIINVLIDSSPNVVRLRREHEVLD